MSAEAGGGGKRALRLAKLQDLNVGGKRVLVRVDYNVPLQGGAVSDTTRIRETLPTLRHLLAAGAKVALISHLGRPGGKAEPKCSLKPVASELERLLGRPVIFAPDCVGPGAEAVSEGLRPGEVALLENLRFHPEEEANGEAFSERLARHGEVFVQDAFGALHRAHASTAGVPRRLPGCIGLLVQKELEFLDRAMGNPKRPFLAILGGAKVSDKIGVITKLLERVDMLAIGGGMAYTFLAAQDVSVGRSILERDKIPQAKAIVEKAYARKVECLLPADHIAARELKPGAEARPTQAMAIPPDLIGADIGPRTIQIFTRMIRSAKTVFWNGPMGVFEVEPFARGSLAVARALAEATRAGAVTIVGGGDSLAALAAAGLQGKVSHCSTGGGASLEFLEGKLLPGLAALGR